MPTTFDPSNPPTGWRIHEEPDFTGDLSTFRGTFFDGDMPLPPLPSGYKSVRVSGAQLEALLGIGVPAYDSLTPAYAPGPPAAGYAFATNELVRATVAGQATEQFFKRRAPGGPAPAPVNGGDATYWEPVNRADVPNLEQRVRNLEVVLTGDVQDALGGYNQPPSGFNPFLTLADGYIDYRNENVVTAAFVVPANGISNVLTGDVRLDLSATQDPGGLLSSLRVPVAAPGPRTVTLGAVGTLDGQSAGFSFQLAPGEVLKIRKPANNNLTSNYQTFERSGAPPAVRVITDVPAAKRSAVVAANVAALVETDPAYFQKYFIDEVSQPGTIKRYDCLISAQSDGTTVWKWFRSTVS